MKVYGVEITEAQIAAGLAAMQGRFRAVDVERAMICSGVVDDNVIAMRAADRLLQKERKAGRILAMNNKNWEAVEETRDAA